MSAFLHEWAAVFGSLPPISDVLLQADEVTHKRAYTWKDRRRIPNDEEETQYLKSCIREWVENTFVRASVWLIHATWSYERSNPTAGDTFVGEYFSGEYFDDSDAYYQLFAERLARADATLLHRCFCSAMDEETCLMVFEAEARVAMHPYDGGCLWFRPK